MGACLNVGPSLSCCSAGCRRDVCLPLHQTLRGGGNVPPSPSLLPPTPERLFWLLRPILAPWGVAPWTQPLWHLQRRFYPDDSELPTSYQVPWTYAHIHLTLLDAPENMLDKVASLRLQTIYVPPSLPRRLPCWRGLSSPLWRLSPSALLETSSLSMAGGNHSSNFWDCQRPLLPAWKLFSFPCFPWEM